jgi:hypothetical protein
MNETTTKMRRRRATPIAAVAAIDLAKLGDGKVAYIRMMTSAEAKAAFPAIEGLPSGINLYALHGADGTPLALTDSQQAAIGHAMGDELEVRLLN